MKRRTCGSPRSEGDWERLGRRKRRALLVLVNDRRWMRDWFAIAPKTCGSVVSRVANAADMRYA